MAKTKRSIIVLWIVVISCILSSVVCASGTLGSAYVFTVNTDDINVQLPSGCTIMSDLDFIGYEADEYINNNAASVYSFLPTSTICVIMGHGAAGRIRCAQQYGTTGEYTRIRSDDHFPIPSYDRALSNLPNLKGSEENRLTIFMGCNTADTPDPVPDSTQITGYWYSGSLPYMAFIKTTTTAMGWTESIQIRSMVPWLESFVNASRVHNISYAVGVADLEILNTQGEEAYEKISSHLIRGDSSQYLGLDEDW